jgi:hypothetical protein
MILIITGDVSLNRILSIQGGMVGGKTSLTKRLEVQIDCVYLHTEIPIPPSGKE